MKKLIVLFILSILINLFLVAGICLGTTYYVNGTTGDNSWDGLAPFCIVLLGDTVQSADENIKKLLLLFWDCCSSRMVLFSISFGILC